MRGQLIFLTVFLLRMKRSLRIFCLLNLFFNTTFDAPIKIEVYMVPGLGLYLKEIFFERYHVKIDVENERKMMANQKLLEKGKPLPAETEPNKVC